MFGPDWNKTVYSSWKPSSGEVKDLMTKIKNKLSENGFSYNCEDVKTACYDPSTSYAQMGFFMAYLFIEK